MGLPIDPFLYVAFALGLVARRFVRPPAEALDRATLGAVYLLLFFLGVSLAPASATQLLEAIPVSVAIAVALVAGSATIAYLLGPRTGRRRARDEPPGYRAWIGVSFGAVVIVGFLLGHELVFDAAAPLELSLYLLLGLVAFGLRWSTSRLAELWVPLTAAIATSVAVALLMYGLLGITLADALACTFAFGFYSLAGPLVTTHAGATIGFVAFFSNFLRENFTMVSSPVLGPRLGAESLVAMGGATSMDTTLYFATTYGDPEAGSLAISSGLLLTILATLTLPLLVGLSG